MGIEWMGVECSACLGVCVCLFLFIDEIDTWKCVFVCLCAYMQVIVFVPLRLGLKLKGRVAENDLKKHIHSARGRGLLPVNGFFLGPSPILPSCIYNTYIKYTFHYR